MLPRAQDASLARSRDSDRRYKLLWPRRATMAAGRLARQHRSTREIPARTIARAVHSCAAGAEYLRVRRADKGFVNGAPNGLAALPPNDWPPLKAKRSKKAGADTRARAISNYEAAGKIRG